MQKKMGFKRRSTGARKKKPGRIEIDGKWYRLKASGKPGVELTRNGNTLSESEFFGRIRSAIRSASAFWEPAKRVMEAATRPYTGTDKRIKKETLCAVCNNWVARSKAEADHIIPLGSLRSYDDVPGFCERAFVEESEGFQAVCKKCHVKKSTEERRGRKANKDGSSTNE